MRAVSRLEIERNGPLVEIEIEATAFLKNMVRIIVGSLCEVGRGAEPPEWIERVLRGGDRRQAGPTAPPEGLLLVRVDYELPPAPSGRLRSAP